MILQYGDIHLHVIEIVRLDRTAVYSRDGVDLLYVKHVLGVVATFSPGGVPPLDSLVEPSPHTRSLLNGADETHFRLGSNPRGFDPNTIPELSTVRPGGVSLETGYKGAIPRNKWHNGFETDIELRYKLMTPRQKLCLWAYRREDGALVPWIESPRRGFTVDATKGPLPRACDVVNVQGATAVTVYWEVETDIPPCPQGSDRLLLSHRWSMTMTHDENYHCTRIIVGQAVFNQHVIQRLNVQPDLVMHAIVHPIPLGSRRYVPHITLDSTGTIVDYEIHDVDQSVTFDPASSGATNIQIVEQIQINRDWNLF